MKKLQGTDGIIILGFVVVTYYLTKDLSKAVTSFFNGMVVVGYLGYILKAKRLSKKLYRNLKTLLKVVAVVTILATLYFYFV